MLGIFENCKMNHLEYHIQKRGSQSFKVKSSVFTEGSFYFEGYGCNRIIRFKPSEKDKGVFDYRKSNRTHNIDISYKNLSILIENNNSKWCEIEFENKEFFVDFLNKHFNRDILVKLNKNI